MRPPAFFLTFIAAIIATVSSAASAPYAGKLGVEAPCEAFVDIVKEHYRWTKPDGHGGWTDLAEADVDPQGWPRTDCRWIVDFRPCAEWAGSIDDPDAYRPDITGTYHGAFKGRASLKVINGPCAIANQTYDPASNTSRFDLVMRESGKLLILEFSDTRRTADAKPGSGLSEFHLIRPGYPADSDQLFTDAYLRCFQSAGFSTIRFMAVLETNGNVEWGPDHTRTQKWANRKTPADAGVHALSTINKKDGWPWEYAIDLCNRLAMDLWINIPASADDDYIIELSRLVKARLDPARAVYIEHSNEVWNFGFLQYAWNKARAKEEVKAGITDYDFDKCGSEELWGQRRHADRVRKIVEIFGQTFGRDQINRRIRGVLAGVTADPQGFFVCGRLAGMLDYLRERHGEPSAYIYAISAPIYYGGPAAAGQERTEHASLDEILAAMRTSVDKEKGNRKAIVDLARRFKLPGGFCAYEGGPDIGGGRNANIANRIRAIRDPRQADLYRLNFADGFWDLGGNVAMQFALASSYTRYGAWGLTDDVAKPDRNSLFKAARDLVGSGSKKP